MLTFTDADVIFTNTWWTRLLKDEALMNAWLQKLQFTELEGYYDNLKAIQKFDVSDLKHVKLLRQTAEDEKRHAWLLENILAERKVPQLDKHTSFFWSEMDKTAVDFTSMCAVFYLGEALATFRFEIMHAHRGTPHDIKQFIEKALPDEQYHARGFLMHSTPEAVNAAMAEYRRVTEAMKKS